MESQSQVSQLTSDRKKRSQEARSQARRSAGSGVQEVEGSEALWAEKVEEFIWFNWFPFLFLGPEIISMKKFYDQSLSQLV